MPVLIAGAASLATVVLMQARAEVAVARQRETLAEARALLSTQHRAMEERIRATEEAARREALDEFMGDIQVEEREYLRETASLFSKRTALIVQQRVCFRNIPLTDWVEQELPGATRLVRMPARNREFGYPPNAPAPGAIPAFAETVHGHRLLQ
jgi:hypothetical protein